MPAVGLKILNKMKPSSSFKSNEDSGFTVSIVVAQDIKKIEITVKKRKIFSSRRIKEVRH